MKEEPKYPRFAGRELHYPAIGSTVEITEGEFIGLQVEVVDLIGSAYAPALRVVVKGPYDELLAYWPWNLREV